MTEAQKLWLAVLARMAVAYPASRYAELGEADLTETAQVWALELIAVPAGAVFEVYERLSRRWTSTFAPNLGDFRATWLDDSWDFWAEANANRDAKAPVEKALPAPAEDDDGPGARTMRAQQAHFERRGFFVCCNCWNACGLHPTARLDLEGVGWVCAAGECDFSSENTLESEELNAEIEGVESESAAETSERGAEGSAVERLLGMYGLEVGCDCSAEQVEVLGRIVLWLDGELEGVLEKWPSLSLLWEEYHFEIQVGDDRDLEIKDLEIEVAA